MPSTLCKLRKLIHMNTSQIQHEIECGLYSRSGPSVKDSILEAVAFDDSSISLHSTLAPVSFSYDALTSLLYTLDDEELLGMI